jgi:hypothetical protein
MTIREISTETQMVPPMSRTKSSPVVLPFKNHASQDAGYLLSIFAILYGLG